MEIDQIMKRLEDSKAADTAGIKTASAPAPSAAPSAEALRTELRQVLSQASGETKTASASPAADSPAGDLVKMASDLANAEEEALMKQAQVYGAAICDGFMTRYAQYEAAAGEIAPDSAKTAATQTSPISGDFQKFAQENPELAREAYDLGYRTKMATLQTQANEQFSAGYQDTMQEVHKIASTLYKHGAEWAQWAAKTAEYQAQQ